MKKNLYRKLIDDALAMPKHEPKKYSQAKKRTLREKIGDVLMTRRSVRHVAANVYNIMIDVGAKKTTVAKQIPVDQLHHEMARHVMKFSAEAITRGGLPVTIFIADRFQAFIDFGHGRVLRLFTILHSVPQEISQASFVVEETRDYEEINFDLVEPVITDAVLWQNDKP